MAKSTIRNTRDGLVKRNYYSSTTSFQAAMGETNAVYLGGTIDAKIKNAINSLASSGIMYASNNGPAYGIAWMKVSASYYGGIVFGYQWVGPHNNNQGNGLALFWYANGGHNILTFT